MLNMDRTGIRHFTVPILIGMVATASRAVHSRPFDWTKYCDGIPSPAAKTLCWNYTLSDSGENRLCAALTWRNTDVSSYFCSGINDACLALESKFTRKSQVVRVCVPFKEGNPCESRLQADLNPRCLRGVCTDKYGKPITNPILPKQPMPSAARLAGTAAIALASSSSSSTAAIIVSASPTVSTGTSSPNPVDSKVPSATAAAAAAQQSDSITVEIDTMKPGRSIPNGYLGISLEWQGIEHYGSPGRAWSDVLRVLGPEPVIRVGGASQDQLTEVPGEASWAAMAKLHREVGMKFIIGVPLNGNNPELIGDFITQARKFLPEQAILGIELGNEPAYWRCPGLAGWDAQGVVQPGWYPYAAYFQRMAKLISGCDKKGEGSKILMGPGWDNLNTFTAQRMHDVLGTDSSCYLRDLTLHSYPYYTKHDFNTRSLLSEDLMREAARNATLHVRSAAAYGHALRITEANSLSGAGEEGTSDTFAAALWTADLSFEFVAAGVKSINFHWGVGGLPNAAQPGGSGVPVYAGIRTYHHVDGTTAPLTRPPWFGYLLFQAVAHPTAAAAAHLGATTADGQPGSLAAVTKAVATAACGKGQIKVWPVLHTSRQPGRKELRIVILNKSEKDDCRVILRLNGLYQDALLTRVRPSGLSGQDRLHSKNVFYGGRRYTDMSGTINGTIETDVVQATAHGTRTGPSAASGSQYEIDMPAATAAVFVAQSQAAVAQTAAETGYAISSSDAEQIETANLTNISTTTAGAAEDEPEQEWPRGIEDTGADGVELEAGQRFTKDAYNGELPSSFNIY